MTTSAASGGSQIFAINPYEDHPSLSAHEAEVLWEYAKLNQQIKDVRTAVLHSVRFRSGHTS